MSTSTLDDAEHLDATEPGYRVVVEHWGDAPEAASDHWSLAEAQLDADRRSADPRVKRAWVEPACLPELRRFARQHGAEVRPRGSGRIDVETVDGTQTTDATRVALAIALGY